MTNYDLIQLMPKGKLAELFLDFALKCQAEDAKFFEFGIVRYDKIVEWLSEDIKGKPEDWEKEPISVLDLKPKIYEALYVSDIRTIGDLIKLRAYDIRKIPHIGDSGMNDILESVKQHFGFNMMA